MIPILHLHDIHPIRHTDLDTAQQIRAILLLCGHLEAQWTRDEDVAFHQLRFIRRHHHNSPSLARDLDAEAEIVIAVTSEVDEVIYGEAGAG